MTYYKLYLSDERGSLIIDAFDNFELSSGFTPEMAGEVFVEWVKKSINKPKKTSRKNVAFVLWDGKGKEPPSQDNYNDPSFVSISSSKELDNEDNV